MSDQANQQSGEKTPEQGKIKLTIQGQEKELSIDELKEYASKGIDYTAKTQEIAEKRRQLEAAESEIKEVKSIVDEMKQDPKLADALNKVYADFKSGRTAKSEGTKDSNLRTLDRLINDEVDPNQRESLRQMRTIIAEEANVPGLKDEINSLKDEIKNLRNITQVSHNARIKSALDTLEKDYGKEIIDKHRKNLEYMLNKYPNQDAKSLLYNFAANDTDFEKLLLDRARKREKEELERKKRGASPTGDSTSQATRLEPKRDRKGRIDTRDLIQRLHNDGRFNFK